MPNSITSSDKRKISLLNADFKIITGIFNERLKDIASHTLSSCQLAMGSDRRIHHGINGARDAIIAAGQKNICSGILDNGYQAAFDYMVLLWVFKVLHAKGLSDNVINHLKNLYSNNLTVVVVNNVPGRAFPNNRWSIRQGDRPSSILFCHGIDPHLVWLDSRLKGIDIYSTQVSGPVLPQSKFPPTISETFRVIGYIDDVKPAITSLAEFSLVDKGSSLFEAASGCILHRNPSSGKVKFLPLGGWKGNLSQKDLPVNYISISDHLDMIGVTLKATYMSTRQENGDFLVNRVSGTIGPWKGGKFMPLTMRCHSVNTYCLSKIWFRCGSFEPRVGDIKKMISLVKSWVYSDLLIKPDEIILYKKQSEGGLNLINIKYRAMAELIKTFIDTAINPKFNRNIYHNALYEWNIEGNREIANPGVSPFYTVEFFTAIKAIKTKVQISLAKLSVGMWYQALMENYVLTETDDNGFEFPILSKSERKNPAINWELTWSLVTHPVLESSDRSFAFRLLHDILITQENIAKAAGCKETSNKCSLCPLDVLGSDLHSLIECPFNHDVGNWLVETLQKFYPNLTPSAIIKFSFEGVDKDKLIPFAWLTVKTLHIIWLTRIKRKSPSVANTRSLLEAGVMVLRKSRHEAIAVSIQNLI